jgi:hypothetical protein
VAAASLAGFVVGFSSSSPAGGQTRPGTAAALSGPGGGSSPKPASVVSSPQFGAPDQTDVFRVASDGSVQVSWVQRAGRWNGPLAISQPGFAPPGAALAVSPQFGIPNQTDVFVVADNGTAQVLWVQGAGRWNGPLTISAAGLAPPGAGLAASPQFGVPDQTDVFVVAGTGATEVFWVQGAGRWNGPLAISPGSIAPAGAGLAASPQFGVPGQTDLFFVGTSGTTQVLWVQGAGRWNGPLTISLGGQAPPGAGLAASPQFGVPDQTDVFVVAGTGATEVFWVQATGQWNGPMTISPTHLAPPGAALAVSPQLGVADQTDVFVVAQDGAAQVLWVSGAGRWSGPLAVSPAGEALPGGGLAASPQFGVPGQTDLWASGKNGFINVSWVESGGRWLGPLALPSEIPVDGPFVSPGQLSAVNLGPLDHLACNNTGAQPVAASPAPTQAPTSPAPGATPPPIQNFAGLARTQSANLAEGAADTNGAAGPDRYVQMINQAVEVFMKDGTPLCNPPPGNGAFWEGTSCGTGRDSDGVVLYDRHAGRWFASRFQQLNGTWYQCVAVSKSTDPLGGYYRYRFQVSSDQFPWFNDYPKFGISPDAYYLTADANKIFRGSGTGIYVVSFDRNRMLQGQDAGEVEFFVPRQTGPTGVSELSMMQPANWDGDVSPPTGAPEYLAQARDDNEGWPSDRVAIWGLQANWTQPSSSTLALTDLLTPESFNSDVCGHQLCIVQPNPDNHSSPHLDSLAYGYLGFRLVYRNFGDHASLLLNQTVATPDNVNRSGIRWYELRKTAFSNWSIFQQGTYAPPTDNNDRWLGSMAMDGQGDIALGFDVSGSQVHPSVAYAARTPSDPPGMLRTEVVLAGGAGSQMDNGFFGDYSQMAVDPQDDCTFWVTNEYYTSQTNGNNHDFDTRIGSFRFPTC